MVIFTQSQTTDKSPIRMSFTSWISAARMRFGVSAIEKRREDECFGNVGTECDRRVTNNCAHNEERSCGSPVIGRASSIMKYGGER